MRAWEQTRKRRRVQSENRGRSETTQTTNQLSHIYGHLSQHAYGTFSIFSREMSPISWFFVFLKSSISSKACIRTYRKFLSRLQFCTKLLLFASCTLKFWLEQSPSIESEADHSKVVSWNRLVQLSSPAEVPRNLPLVSAESIGGRKFLLNTLSASRTTSMSLWLSPDTVLIWN